MTNYMSPFGTRLTLFYCMLPTIAALPISPPILQSAPIPDFTTRDNTWCRTQGVEALSSPLVRIGTYLIVWALLSSRIFAPSSQPIIILALSSIIMTFCATLLTHTTTFYQTVIGEHPLALELFLIALPCWMALLCTSPLRIPRLVSHMNLGTTMLVFFTQTAAVLTLACSQIYISTGARRTMGMDFRIYELTRGRDEDLKLDPSGTEFLFVGDNKCGRRAVVGRTNVQLDSVKWSNFMVVWAVFALLMWCFVTARWIRQMVGYVYLLNSQPQGSSILAQKKIDIKDALPAVAELYPLFNDGNIPHQAPSIQENLRESGMQPMTTGWGQWCREKLGLQLVVLDKAKRHMQFTYGLTNPLNLPFATMVARVIGFIVVIASVETTIVRWNVVFSNEKAPWSSLGLTSTGNGILVMAIGLIALVAVIFGWIGDRVLWRIFRKIGGRVRSDKGIRSYL